MMLSKGAFSMLSSRYKAVLKKCHILNVLSCTVVAGTLILGSSGITEAKIVQTTEDISASAQLDEDLTVGSGGKITVIGSAGGVDYTLGTNQDAKPKIDTAFRKLTVDGGSVILSNDGARLNAGAVTVNSGTLHSDSNIHVGSIKKDQITNGLRVYSLTINGGTVEAVRKLGIVTDGEITINGGKLSVGQLENDRSNGTLKVNKGGILEVKSGLKNTQSGTFELQNNGGIILISNTDTENGAFTWTLGGTEVNFDPAFGVAGDTSNASLGALSFKGSSIDGCINVGENSIVTLGSTDAELLRTQVLQYQNTGKGTWGTDVTAALAIRSPLTLDATNGGVQVDGNWVFTNSPVSKVTADNAIFADKSLLVIDAAGIGTDTALSGAGNSSTLTVADGARLYIVGGAANSTLKITDNFGSTSTISDKGWASHLETDSPLLSATGAATAANGAYSVTLKANAAQSAFPQLSGELAGLVDNVVQHGLDTNSSNAGIAFISRATSSSFIGKDKNLAAATIEGATKITSVSAVPQMAIGVANSAASVAATRTSLASPLEGGAVALADDGSVQQDGISAGDGMKNGFGMWIMPMYQNQQGFGFESGNFDTGFRSSFGGVAIGADYTINNAVRLGVTCNLGSGYSQSTGDFNETKNQFTYWGVGAYAGYTYDNFGITADIGYTTTQNDIEQDLPSGMRMSKLEADNTATNVSAGLRGEYKVSTDLLDIIPHVGVRLNSLHVKSFDLESAGQTVMSVDDMNATIWQFPVGVTFSKDIATSNGWTVTPQVDLSVIPAAGDIEARQDVKIPGIPGSAEMDSSIMDAFSGRASLGVEAKNENGFSVGVNYSFQGSAHTADHGVQATFRYEF